MVKDYGHLQKKQVDGKDGHKHTVYVDPDKDVRNPRERAIDNRRSQLGQARAQETDKDRIKQREIAVRYKQFATEAVQQRKMGTPKKIPPPVGAIMRIYAKGKANVGGMLAKVHEVVGESVKVMLPSGSISEVPFDHLEFAKAGFVTSKNFILIQKAVRDRSNLVKVKMTNKLGNVQTVWRKALERESEGKSTGPSHPNASFDAIQQAHEHIRAADASTLEKATALAELDRNTSEYVVSDVPQEKDKVEVDDKSKRSITTLQNDAVSKSQIQAVSLADISAESEGQIRKSFNPEAIRELAESIAAVGLMAPIVLRPDPENKGKFKIVAGERRFRALSVLAKEGRGDGMADAIVRELSDQDKDILQVIENHVRVNNTPLEISEHYNKLITAHSMTPKAISDATGDSVQKVKDYISLNTLAPELKSLLRTGDKTLNKTSAIILAQLPSHGEQVRAYSIMLRHNMTTAMLREQVKQMQANRDVALFSDDEGKGEVQKRAESELGDKNPDKLVGNLNKLLEDQKQRLYKFINSQGDLSAIGVIAAGQAQKTLDELARVKGEIDRIEGKIRHHHARLTERDSPQLFKGLLRFLFGVGK